MRLLFTLLLVSAGLVIPVRGQEQNQPPRVLTWNDLGMHCMDPDFEVFTILPPYNTMHAQVMVQGQVVTSAQALAVTYEASADANGSINTTSIGKTDFWTWVGLIFGISPPPDTGLVGYSMPGPANTPQGMDFGLPYHWFTGEGIPLTPIDDSFQSNPFPLMRVRVTNGSGAQLATTRAVAPISTELECTACHGSNGSPFAKPKGGWNYDPNPVQDDRWNILRLHDERHVGQPAHTAAAVSLGYDPAGLEDTARAGTPIFCAACHGSNALPGTGVAGISKLTSAIHTRHGPALAANGVSIDDDPTRAGCFSCHPGFVTQCLRGAMGRAVAPDGSLDMQCQSCHGNATAVGDPARVGWLEEPSCQECHTGTATNNAGAIRFSSVFASPGVPHVPADPIFATNADVPAAGFDLFRFSEGHGGLQCAACHGPPHAIYPTNFANDNVQSMEFQGHEGTISECTACHTSGKLDNAGLTGPHGMHPVGLAWAGHDHGDVAEQLGLGSCRDCHGATLRGTVLSRAHANRSYAIGDGFGTMTFVRGAEVGCYACHNGPQSENPTNNSAPTVSNLLLTTPSDTPSSLTLVASDPNGNPLTLRIANQPKHGRVALQGTLATYIPSGDYQGPDSFSYLAFDNAVSSGLGTVSVNVQTAACGTIEAYGFGCGGTDAALPVFSANGCAKSGETVQFNVTGALGGSMAFVFLGAGRGELPTDFGCVLRILPLIPRIIPLSLIGVGPGGGQASFDAVVPPGVTGAVLNLQIFIVDPGTVQGYSSTNALELTFL